MGGQAAADHMTVSTLHCHQAQQVKVMAAAAAAQARRVKQV